MIGAILKHIFGHRYRPEHVDEHVVSPPEMPITAQCDEDARQEDAERRLRDVRNRLQAFQIEAEIIARQKQADTDEMERR